LIQAPRVRRSPRGLDPVRLRQRIKGLVLIAPSYFRVLSTLACDSAGYPAGGRHRTLQLARNRPPHYRAGAARRERGENKGHLRLLQDELLTTPSEAMFCTFTALGYTDAATVASVWPASVAAEHKEPAWNQCARDSDHVFERGGEKATVFLPHCLGDEEVIHLRGDYTRR
jgi:hypothetical protein